jgi:hypothetical protein
VVSSAGNGVNEHHCLAVVGQDRDQGVWVPAWRNGVRADVL